MKPFFLNTLAVILIVKLAAVEAGWFYYERCLCTTYSQVFNYHVGYYPSGQFVEQTISAVATCKSNNDPSACEGFDLTNVCGDTSDPGIGQLCYNQNVFSSDTISVNGQTFNVKNYPVSWYTQDSQNQASCDASCYDFDGSAFRSGAGAFGFTVTNLPDFHGQW